jgi:hypothetical protein
MSCRSDRTPMNVSDEPGLASKVAFTFWKYLHSWGDDLFDVASLLPKPTPLPKPFLEPSPSPSTTEPLGLSGSFLHESI